MNPLLPFLQSLQSLQSAINIFVAIGCFCTTLKCYMGNYCLEKGFFFTIGCNCDIQYAVYRYETSV